MAKNSIRDYSATNSSNTDIQSIDISEGCSPAGINNAIREVMADLKDVSTGAVALESPAFDSASLTGDLTFGDSDKAIFGAGSDLQIYHDGGSSWVSDVGAGNLKLTSDGSGVFLQKGATEFMGEFLTDGAVRLYYDNAAKFETTATGVEVTGGLTTTGNVGIGTSTVDSLLHLQKSDVTAYSATATDGQVGIGPTIYLENPANSNTTVGGQIVFGMRSTEAQARIGATGGASPALVFGTNDSEAARLDASGNLLVGTDTGGGTIGTYNGFGALSGGTIFSSGTSNRSIFSRRSTDGSIIEFRKDGTAVGSIGTDGGDLTIDGAASHSGLRFITTYIQPRLNGSASNGGVDLGAGAARFNDIFAVNATIQTSDANEKQQIAALTDAEITAAKAISKLFKTFKWNSAVTEKGDAARTHAGVIAQDVEAAMTAAGLDAGDYAFFISTTWWETQTEVPAVEAVEAVDAVYEDVVIPAVEEEVDEDGNVIVEAQPERTEQRLVSEAIEAVEAVEAYTRTDTYDTAEEAPEGAVELTRLGIRYPELLAFVGAATEQRLANIETRLAALEAN